MPTISVGSDENEMKQNSTSCANHSTWAGRVCACAGRRRRAVRVDGPAIRPSDSRRSMRPLAVLVAALLMLGPVGCAHRAPFPTAEPAPKPDIGTVGLVVGTDSSNPYFQRPGTVGAGEGAKQGAKTGAVAP